MFANTFTLWHIFCEHVFLWLIRSISFLLQKSLIHSRDEKNHSHFFASGNRSQSRHILRFLTLFDLVFRMQFYQFSSPKAVLGEGGGSLLKNEFLSIKEYGTRLRYDENILLSNVDVYFLFINLWAFYCFENSVVICKWYFYWTLLGIIVIFFM